MACVLLDHLLLHRGQIGGPAWPDRLRLRHFFF